MSKLERAGAMLTLTRGASGSPGLSPAGLSPGDRARLASVGLRTHRLRAGLAALGIAIGIAAMVGVLGISASSQAGLLAEIDQLGTNLLTVTPGQTAVGGSAELPKTATGMIGVIRPVTEVTAVGALSQHVYRSDRIPAIDTSGIQLYAAQPDLLHALHGTVASGAFLNAATSHYPAVVLGAVAASRLGIDHAYPNERIWIGGQWFYVRGILDPLPLAPEIDESALIGAPVAGSLFGWDAAPTTIYVRADTDQVQAVDNVLAATANPENPDEVQVSQPSDALVARSAAKNAFTGLFLGLGALALIVGGVGVANIMVISVLERRSEIGLRRALGATKSQICAQFLSESVLLSVLGGAAGITFGAITTAIYATAKHWATVIPPLAVVAGAAAALAIGGVAGLLPALRAARLTPTDALRTT
jgi:putative ABC transport system permease protein